MRILSALGVLLLLASLVLAEESQKEIYTRASAILKQAERAESKNDKDLAWQRYAGALKLFSQAKKRNPDWKKKVVAEKIETCSHGFARTAPLVVKEFDQSRSESSGLAAKVDRLEATKMDRLKQMDWEKDFLDDRIEPLMMDFIRRVAIARGVTTVAPQLRKRAEGAESIMSEVPITGLEARIERRANQLGVIDLDTADTDSDGLSDAREISLRTDPDKTDTDGDGFYDGDEVKLGYDPLDASGHPQIEEVNEYDEDKVDWIEQESYVEE